MPGRGGFKEYGNEFFRSVSYSNTCEDIYFYEHRLPPPYNTSNPFHGLPLVTGYCKKNIPALLFRKLMSVFTYKSVSV